MSLIKNSELILNPDGTVYHLNLRPEHVADTLITVGDPARVGKVSAHFDKVEFEFSKREFITHTGYFKGKRISVISTGIGTDNIDIVINELDALVNIDLSKREIKREQRSLDIFRLGTSGGLQEDLLSGSISIATHGIGLDNLMNYYDYPDADEEGLLKEFRRQVTGENNSLHPYIAPASFDLLSLFPEDIPRGITVTCSGFYGPQGRVLRGGLAFPNLVDNLTNFRHQSYRINNFEMETSGIYGLGALLGHRCLSVNTIIANRVTKTFVEDPGRAVDEMIRRVLEIIVK